MGGYSTETNTYKRLRYLNAVRKYLMSDKAQTGSGGKTFAEDQGRVMLSTREDLIFARGPVLVALNNVRLSSLSAEFGKVRRLIWALLPTVASFSRLHRHSRCVRLRFPRRTRRVSIVSFSFLDLRLRTYDLRAFF